MPDLIPVILSGGSGTRLWPLSRSLQPKQFASLAGETLFSQAVHRAMALKNTAQPLVICNHTHRFLAAAELQGSGLEPHAGIPQCEKHVQLVLEPEGRNTAPAIAVACQAALERDKNPIVLVLPSDHAISPQSAFSAAVEQAVAAARQGLLVSFGVSPTYPATGYGYIVHGKTPLHGGAHPIEHFVEKPDAARAGQLLARGNCLWNSGMFVFPAQVYLDELRAYAPAIYEYSLAAWQRCQTDLDFIRLDADAFRNCPADSVDYAVMEHTNKACVVPLTAAWQDLGSWESFSAAAPKDENGNSAIGDVKLLDSRNSYVYAASRLVAGIGLENMIVVESPDAVLLMPHGQGQEVKTLLDILKAEKRPEAESHLKVHRPWGQYEILALGPNFQVKHIIVKAGAALSLQSHQHRAEHWVVVRGRAGIQVEGKKLSLAENQSTYIPPGAKHRLENSTDSPLELVEIQSGEYLGEDDIIRYEDLYNR